MNKTAGLMLTLASLGGCNSVYSPGTVARDWSCKIRELQIQPLFPPREDVQIGDVYLGAASKSATAIEDCGSHTNLGFSTLPKNSDFVHISLFVGGLEVAKEVDEHYGRRIDFPKTQVNQLSESQGAITVKGFTTPEVTTGLIVPAQAGASNFKRLKLVGFPDFMAVKVSTTDIGAILPIFGYPSNLGFTANAVESASISVPVAESYGIPAPTILRKLNELQKTSLEGNECVIDARNLKKLFPKSIFDNNILYLSALYEVYYTRAISVNISLKQTGSFSLQADLPKPTSEMVAPSAPISTPAASVPTSSASAPSASVLPASSPADVAAADLAKARTAAAQETSKLKGLPGVIFDTGTSSSSKISMTRVFDRPIAIGYRAVNFELAEPTDEKKCFDIVSLSRGPTYMPLSKNLPVLDNK